MKRTIKFNNSGLTLDINKTNNQSLFVTLGNIIIGIQPNFNDITLRITGTGGFLNHFLVPGSLNGTFTFQVISIQNLFSIIFDNITLFTLVNNSSKTLSVSNNGESLQTYMIQNYTKENNSDLLNNIGEGIVLIKDYKKILLIENSNDLLLYNYSRTKVSIKTIILTNSDAKIIVGNYTHEAIIFSLLKSYSIRDNTSGIYGLGNSNIYNIIIDNKTYVLLKERNNSAIYNYIYYIGIFILLFINFFILAFPFLIKRLRSREITEY